MDLYLFLILAIILFVSLLLFSNNETIWLVRHTLWRDLSIGSVLLGVKKEMGKSLKEGRTVVDVFERTVSKNPDRPMFKFEGKTWTFKQVNREANAIAAFFQEKGFKKGDCVALLMENQPELVIYWLGLVKVGVVSALINFNLRQAPLVHSIKVAAPKALVCSDSLVEPALRPIASEIEGMVDQSSVFVLQYKFPAETIIGYTTINDEIEARLDKEFPRPKLEMGDKVLYIYTSGTTGMPKAAKMTHLRICMIFISFNQVLKTTAEDVVWSPLPLYHSNAGLVGLGLALSRGSCIAFRPKFSASNFWKDICESESTVFIYLGELCRYIYAQPVAPEERKHKLRVIAGCGLKKDMWNSFKDRYVIPSVLEYYGATEGNCGLVNIPGKEGAIGFTSRLFPFLLPLTLVKVDENGNLVRDKDGICVKSGPGEPGHIVGKIIDSDPVRRFDGYVGSEETNKKITHDVFQKGDRAFMSGDLLEMDREGYFYFRDRTGDTFRWKGENVSTTEVEAVIFPAVGQQDVIVFGVTIPNSDGRAGMAAILNEGGANVDIDKLAKAVNESLPVYARPMFVRLLESTSQYLTGTYKLRKMDLAREGYSAKTISDAMYYYDLRTKGYLPLSSEALAGVMDNTIRF